MFSVLSQAKTYVVVVFLEACPVLLDEAAVYCRVCS